MTKEQEQNINNALLALMYEWKLGTIDQKQALKEFKQCMKYYARNEDVIRFEQSHLILEDEILNVGYERVVKRRKQEMAEKIAAEALEKGCASFEDMDLGDYYPMPSRRFTMKMEMIVQPQNH